MTGRVKAIRSLSHVLSARAITGKGVGQMPKAKRLILTDEEVLTACNMYETHIKQDITGPMLVKTAGKFRDELQRRKDRIDADHKRKD